MKRPSHRVFDYEPRYYKPEEDENEKRKKRLGFRYNRKVRRKSKSTLYWFILLAIILYIYLKMSGTV